MIKQIDGNLLDSPTDLIAHCCNCFCVMGAGVAAGIRTKYPEAYEADCKTKKGDHKKLGTVSFAQVKTPDNSIKGVVNIYGQFDMGGEKPVNYEAVYNGL